MWFIEQLLLYTHLFDVVYVSTMLLSLWIVLMYIYIMSKIVCYSYAVFCLKFYFSMFVAYFSIYFYVKRIQTVLYNKNVI